MKLQTALSGLLAAALLLPSAAWAREEEPPKNDGPFLEQIQINTDTAARGGKISIAADAWDDDGIFSIWVRFEHDESGTLLALPLELRFGDPRLEGRYSAEIKIPENAPLGRYELRSVVLTDTLDNVSRYFREEDMERDKNAEPLADLLEEKIAFTVAEDAAGPTLLACSVLEDSIETGRDENGNDSTFRVTLSASDEIAGFQKVTLIFASEEGKKYYASLDRGDWLSGDIYQKDVPVRERQAAGEYKLVKATLEDRAGNKTILGYGKDAQPLDSSLVCRIKIISRENSGLAPALQTVTVGERREHIDTDIHRTGYRITVKTKDRGSGLHHVTVKFKNRQTGDTVSKVIRVDENDHSLGEGVCAGWLTVSSWEQPGTFLLDTVVVTDKAGNVQTYRRPDDCSGSQLPLPCAASFTVEEGPDRKDTQAPVVSALEMAETTEEGVPIPLRARISDDLSGVDAVTARFENKEGRVVTVRLYPAEDGWYSGKVSGSRIKRHSQYQLTRLTVTDKAGNRRVYQRQEGIRGEALPRQIAFTVVKSED